MSIQDAQPKQPAYPFRPLSQTFADPNSLRKGIVSFFDQRDSTAAKVNKPEASWVNETAFLYDAVILTAQELYPDVVWNVLGDGVVLFYPDPNAATAAVQTAIAVLEKVDRANRPDTGAGQMGSVDMQLSVGVGSGSLRWFNAPGGAANAIGTVADRAARLCSSASPQALFIDSSTASATNFLEIESELGRALGRSVDAYQGEKQTIVLKGLKDPVAYYEVYWGRQLFGVRSEVLTVAEERASAAVDKVARERQTPPRPTGRALSTTQGEKLTGVVKNWIAEKSYGFITAESGEELFFAPNLMVHPLEDVAKLAAGIKVAFVAIEPSPNGKNRRAAAVLLAGEYSVGTIAKLPTDNAPNGWVVSSDATGHQRYVHAAASELTGLKLGDEVSYKLMVTPKGATAVDFGPPEDEDD